MRLSGECVTRFARECGELEGHTRTPRGTEKAGRTYMSVHRTGGTHPRSGYRPSVKGCPLPGVSQPKLGGGFSVILSQNTIHSPRYAAQ